MPPLAGEPGCAVALGSGSTLSNDFSRPVVEQSIVPLSGFNLTCQGSRDLEDNKFVRAPASADKSVCSTL